MTETRLFNDGWEFAKLPLSATSKEEADVHWMPVDVPHDWLIYDTKNLYADSEGRYRKHFHLEPLKSASRVSLYFDGVYMDTLVLVNGRYIGEWKYGYTSFEFDITEALKPRDNILELRVRYRAPNSRWYSGAGIYRDVWYITRPSEHLAAKGIYISTRKKDAVWTVIADARVNFSSALASYTIRRTILDQSGRPIATKESSLETKDVIDQKTIKNTIHINVQGISVWDIENPILYRLNTELFKDGELIDADLSVFGFRTVAFDSDQGFYLNDRRIKLHGVCLHHDLGCLGAAVNRAAIQRQLKIMKTMGVNALRCSHNPPASVFMELADELGLLVVSEAFDMWERPKTPYDYARFFAEWSDRDVASWVRRDRNHPCVILWSIGNEIYDTHADIRGAITAKRLMDLVHLHDPRGNAFVTIGSNYMPWENAQRCADLVKIVGYNYAEDYYAAHHVAHPDWIIYGSETGSIVQSRGIYHFPASRSLLADDDEQCSSLGNSATSWGAKSIEACIIDDRDTNFCAGMFVWSGFDYIGEPTPYHTKNSYFGQVDTCGFPKDSYYLYRAAWTDYRTNPFVHIFPYWDFNEGQMIDLRVCSNAPWVELFFNDSSLGCVPLDQRSGKKLLAEWRLPFSSGELRALAYDEKGDIIASAVRRSFGEALYLGLNPDKSLISADGRDLSFIEISALDAGNNPVENATNRVRVSVSGAGRLVGLDNGDSTDYDQYKGISRRLFSGKLLAVVASKTEPGAIIVSAVSPGLPEARLELTAKAAPPVKGVSAVEDVSALYKASRIKRDISRETELPVRRIALDCKADRTLSPSLPQTRVLARILPANASYRELEWRVTDDAGIDTNIVKLETKGQEATLTALGDGFFRLRCLSRNGGPSIRLISELEFEIRGLGPAYINPYKFVSAGLYTVSVGELGNGNERGVATGRTGESQIGFRGLDFGRFGSDTLTIPIFALNDDVVPIEIWEGLPGQAGAEKLLTACYQKPSVWNTYQEESFTLSRRIKGVATLCIVLRQKVHIKGFIFSKPNKAYSLLKAKEADRVYGDSYTYTREAVEKIGNNVTLEFDEMDFGVDGTNAIAVRARSRLSSNTIRLRFLGEADELIENIELARSDDYSESIFRLRPVFGLRTVSFIFLPGSYIDFAWFRFIRSTEAY